MLDLLIQNGLIFDGLGSAPMRGDIGIEKGKIVAIASSLPPMLIKLSMRPVYG